jgi:hypothetical protein
MPFLGMLASVLVALATQRATAFDPPTRETIANLSPEEKNAILKKKDRFDALPPAEQERLRALSNEIAASPHSDQLHATLDRYHEWLKTLTTKQRTDLLGLPTEERVERIKTLMQEQEKARLREWSEKQLPEADLDAIFTFLEEFMKQHEEEFLKRVRKDYADRLREQDGVARRRSIMRSIVMRGPGGDFPMPAREDVERLLARLSPATLKVFESFKTPEEKQQLARRWIFSAMVSRVFPAPSEEDLQKVFDSLSDGERVKLERKSPEEVKRELTQHYHWRNSPGRGGPGGSAGPFGSRQGGLGNGPGSGGPGQGPPGGGERRGPNGGPPPKRPEPVRSDAPAEKQTNLAP